MRVIAGTARGRRLDRPPGSGVRPTAMRAREALFSILHSALGPGGLAGRKVLDLFAGSGALGLEALSRGAAAAVFVEKDPVAIAVLRANAARCLLASRATIVEADAHAWLARPAAGAPCDLVLADPPYAGDSHEA
ncbi:MAG: RsmD family RNA methyltransferase, partial [Rhodospirillales bacterium]